MLNCSSKYISNFQGRAHALLYNKEKIDGHMKKSKGLKFSSEKGMLLFFSLIQTFPIDFFEKLKFSYWGVSHSKTPATIYVIDFCCIDVAF